VTNTPVVFAPAGPPGNDLNASNRDRRSIGAASREFDPKRENDENNRQKKRTGRG
jgi:hypothetical protein